MKRNDAPKATSLPLADLEVFVAVAEADGFSAAARRLGVSKAMVSTTVSRLEVRLGVRLLHRTTRRVSLTEAGMAALPHAQRALHAARDAEEAAALLRASPRGTLRISAPMSFGLLHVAPAIAAFAAANPEVSVDLVLDDRMVDLVGGGFDLALRIGTLADSSLVVQRLATTRNVLVASPAYLRRAGAPRSPEHLAEHAALVYSVPVSAGRWTLTRGERTAVVRVRGPLQANNSLVLRDAARDGMGIASIPLFVAAAELAAGRLLPVLPKWRLPEHGVYAVTSARGFQPPKTRAFIEFFRGRIAALRDG